MDKANSNIHVEGYGVNATSQTVTSIKIAEDAGDNVSINGNAYVKNGTAIGTLSLGDVTLVIPSEAGDITIEDVSIKNDGVEIGKADLKITFTEE